MIRRMNLIVGLVLVLVVSALVASATMAQSKPDKKIKDKYKAVAIFHFDVKEGVEFPTDYLVTLTEELTTQLRETKKFKEVLREGETSSESAASTLKLVGTVTKFDAGSRAKRYLIGFGAGKTKIVAHVKFVDAATGDVLFEDDVDGKVIMGFAGGDSVGATRGLAKEVATKAKQQF